MFDFHRHKVILASSSPRRKDILSSLGIEFDVFSPDVDETFKKGEKPNHYALRIAKDKALVAAQKHPNCIIIAADTSVFHGNKLIDKAKTDEDVHKFISYLSGRNHSVHSGLAVIFPNQKCISKHIKSTVKFKRLTNEEVDMYVNSKEGIGKAGGYAIQGIAQTFIININGSPSGIIGLPIYELSQILKGYDGK